MPAKLRKPLSIGALALSIQASADHASFPATDNLDLDQYTHLQVAIFKNGKIIRPSDCGISEFDLYFSDDCVARCMAAPVLETLKRALESLA